MAERAPLKLQIRSVDDVSVLSALLQDALINSRDIHIDLNRAEIALIADRYCWEGDKTQAERVLAGLRIGGVKAVQHKNMAVAGDETLFYNLLDIAYEKASEEQSYLIFTFSAGSAMRLQIDGLMMAFSDIAPPRPAIATPDHSHSLNEDADKDADNPKDNP